ncbi:uncharacterized protein [Eurosta solidaginis]|uniref:uncharacterized protein isoform X4 n=1 Tax=Eurosta solidaginis TaxID=178769 RepID=UPI003530F389
MWNKFYEGKHILWKRLSISAVEAEFLRSRVWVRAILVFLNVSYIRQAYTLEKVKYISSGSRIFTLACLGPRYFSVSERVLYKNI